MKLTQLIFPLTALLILKTLLGKTIHNKISIHDSSTEITSAESHVRKRNKFLPQLKVLLREDEANFDRLVRDNGIDSKNNTTDEDEDKTDKDDDNDKDDDKDERNFRRETELSRGVDTPSSGDSYRNSRSFYENQTVVHKAPKDFLQYLLHWARFCLRIVLIIVAIFAAVSAVTQMSCFSIVFFKSCGKQHLSSILALAHIVCILSYNWTMYLAVISIDGYASKAPINLLEIYNSGALLIIIELSLTLIIYWVAILSASASIIRHSSTSIPELSISDDEPTEVCSIMCIGNEPLHEVMGSINAIVNCKYPHSRLTLVLAFGDVVVSPLYCSIVQCIEQHASSTSVIDKDDSKLTEMYSKIASKYSLFHDAESQSSTKYPTTLFLQYYGISIHICRFNSPGKRLTQMSAFQYIDSLYANKITVKPCLLLLDADAQIHEYSLHHLVKTLAKKSNHRYIDAVTGVVSNNLTAGGCVNAWRCFEAAENIEKGLIMGSLFEQFTGSVLRLSGSFTLVKYKAFSNVVEAYANKPDQDNVFEYARRHFGDDRFLTQLILEAQNPSRRISINAAARCSSHGSTTYMQLLAQRRRAYQSKLANETEILCSPVMWRRYPLQLMLKTFSVLQFGPVLTFFMSSQILLGNAAFVSMVVDFGIIMPRCLGLCLVFGLLHQKEIKQRYSILIYPVITVLFGPFLSIVFELYGILATSSRQLEESEYVDDSVLELSEEVASKKGLQHKAFYRDY